ncbi:MAG: formylglycine-generating enzyme family protein, partial [Kiritimatiellae bacterium]|nr:formylglycine-generating enzyme family protein [Kiritimatiellia bacterium]
GHLNDMAWYDDNSGSQTHTVGKNLPNDWGFYDMHGNVLEWCADWFSTAGAQSVDPKGPSTGSFRVLRGGCWFFFGRDCRSAYRLKREPNLRNCIFGFRLACSEADIERLTPEDETK